MKKRQCSCRMTSLGVLLGLVSAAIPPVPLAAGEPNANEAGSVRTATGSQGIIEGTVIYQSDPARPWRYARYYVKDRDDGRLAEAVVALAVPAPIERAPSDEPGETIIDQKDFQFTPEIIAIRAGDRVKFTNSDRELHNVRAFHPLHQFNVNMPSRGEHVETFAKAGGTRRPYQIGCVYHSAMRAWVFVFDHPYFHVSGDDGRFRLADVAPGEYTLEVVHAAGELKRSEIVEVKAGQTTHVDIIVSPDDRLKGRP